MILRPMEPADAAPMLAIYRPHVEGSAVSFEEQTPTLQSFAERLRSYQERFAAVVAEDQGRVLGYAYASTHRERSAYRWSVETTVYVATHAQRQGVGRRLYGSLLPALRDRGYCNAYAGVALPNEASVALHRAVGFACIGCFPKVGWKFGRWHDVAWLHVALREAPPAGP